MESQSLSAEQKKKTLSHLMCGYEESLQEVVAQWLNTSLVVMIRSVCGTDIQVFERDDGNNIYDRDLSGCC